MPTPTTPVLLTKIAQERITSYCTSCASSMTGIGTLATHMRSTLLQADVRYASELDKSADNADAKNANRTGDISKLQSFIMPVVLPAVEGSVVYQASVFLTGVPLFGVAAGPAQSEAGKQLESVIDASAVRGGWVREFMLAFRDGAKYNLGALEVSWSRETVPVLDTDLSNGNGLVATAKEVTWEGSKVVRWDLYNSFWDTRVNPNEVHIKGDFAGHHALYSRVALRAFIDSLPDASVMNVAEAFKSSPLAGANGAAGGYYCPQINAEALVDTNTSFDWGNWLGTTSVSNPTTVSAMYQVTKIYVRLLPADFDLIVPNGNSAQVWMFLIVNNQVLIYAERLTNAHGFIPVIFFQSNDTGLGYQSKSLTANLAPVQAITTTLMQSALAARHRELSDRALYDPSRIDSASVNSTNPGAKIAVKPSAFGTDVKQAYYSIPFENRASGDVLSTIGMLMQYSQSISGQNPVQQGQFVKGNKTQQEFASVMQNANGREQMVAMGLEASLFTPLKHILLMDTLQYQQNGTAFSRASKQVVSIDSVKLRQAALAFKVSDGLTPTAKLIDADALVVALQQIGSSPQIGAGYNIAPLFTYLMEQQGAELSEFEKSQQQIAYEQAMQSWQQLVLQLFQQNKELKAEQLPPQPQPQQYGYVPGQLASEQGQPPQQSPLGSV